MYCGGKKKPPSSPASMISRVFQVSWFPRIKQEGTKKRHSPPFPALHREGRFYSTDDDDGSAYWRLSFHTQDRTSITGIPVPSFRGRETEEKQYKDRIMHNHERRLSRKKQLGRGIEDDEKLKPVMEKYIFPIETPVYHSRNCSLMSPVDEGYASEGRVSSSEAQNSGKLNDANKFQMEPMCMIRRKSLEKRIKPKNNSQKREFRVRVLEEMKKERTKSKKKEKKDRKADGTTVYDSFAEAKTSFDLQKDFRDSMVEMICEKEIRQSEELEDLLACYLTLNRDEYHHLIIRVFQQVWSELRG